MVAKESIRGKDQQNPTHIVNPICTPSQACECRFLTMNDSVSKPNLENLSENFTRLRSFFLSQFIFKDTEMAVIKMYM